MPAPDLVFHPDQPPRLSSVAGLPIREDTAYTNHKGQESVKVRKGVETALAKLQEPLRKHLEPNETILNVTYGQAPISWKGQLTFGHYVYHVTAVWLVLTNRRLLALRVKPKFRSFGWLRSLRSVHWGDIEEAKVKGWLSPELHLKYRNGTKEKYWGLRGPFLSGFRPGIKKKLNPLLAALLPASLGETSPAQAMVALCPECRAVLAEGVSQCGGCGLGFKTREEVVWRSWVFPGGGYF